nr:MAG TPA: S-adenosyl-L-methionine methyltransferase [Caudoviricetes sp.]
MKQRFTSAATAVNGKAGKLPAIYKKINLDGLFILDIGCGAEIKHIRDYVTAKSKIFLMVYIVIFI